MKLFQFHSSFQWYASVLPLIHRRTLAPVIDYYQCWWKLQLHWRDRTTIHLDKGTTYTDLFFPTYMVWKHWIPKCYLRSTRPELERNNPNGRNYEIKLNSIEIFAKYRYERDYVTKKRLSSPIILIIQGPGFSTNGDGILPPTPATVTKAGVVEGLNTTWNIIFNNFISKDQADYLKNTNLEFLFDVNITIFRYGWNSSGDRIRF